MQCDPAAVWAADFITPGTEGWALSGLRGVIQMDDGQLTSTLACFCEMVGHRSTDECLDCSTVTAFCGHRSSYVRLSICSVCARCAS
jgi:hypothetical protein